MSKRRNDTACPLLGSALGLMLCFQAYGESAQGYPEISRLFYDFEVAGYCGLVTDRAGRGFQRRAAHLIERYDVDQDTVDRLRGDAWQAAHAEWQNRGLGGFRNWCRTDGRAAAERFEKMTVSEP